jgi:hypothetical protein
MVAADFNRDGNLDLATSNDNTVTVLPGSGRGGFSANRVTLKTGRYPEAIVSGDFDHNNRPDLVVGNSSGNSISILLAEPHCSNQPQMCFRPAETVAQVGDPESIIALDINGDKNLDIGVAGSFGQVEVLLGNGNGTFTRPIGTQVIDAQSIVPTSSSAQGGVGLAVISPRLGKLFSFMIKSRRLVGTSQERVPLFSRPLLSGDFNGDRRSDLVVVNPQASVASLLIAGSRANQPWSIYKSSHQNKARTTSLGYLANPRGFGREPLRFSEKGGLTPSWLKYEFLNREPLLSIDQHQAIYLYQRDPATNQLLRNPRLKVSKSELTRARKEIHGLDGAILRTPLNQSIVTYRGVDAIAIPKRVRLGGQRSFTEKGYSSTSLLRAIGSAFAETKDGGVLMQIRIPKGACVTTPDFRGWVQSEIILPRKTKFTVRRIRTIKIQTNKKMKLFEVTASPRCKISSLPPRLKQ